MTEIKKKDISDIENNIECLINNFDNLDIKKNIFNINEFLDKIKKIIYTIMDQPEKNEILYDILNTEDDIKYSLISLKIKQKQMKYGKIWQYIIGEYDKFENLKNGHYSGVDIISYEKKIIIELKNRYNTDNSSSRKINLDKLVNFKLRNNDFICIYGVINEKNKIGKKKIILHNGIEITYLSGNFLFEFIFQHNKDIILNKIKQVIIQWNNENIMNF